MTDLRELLDDAAFGAARELRIDVAEVRARSEVHRKYLQRRRSRFLLVAAAVLVVALAAPVLRSTVVRPATRPTGLPAAWFTAPASTPLVTRARMPAASMILAASVSSSTVGPVLVSADGRRYARLPWTADDGLAALSADGTRVAWLTDRWSAGRPAFTLHLLRLASGRVQDVDLTAPLSGVLLVEQLLWFHGDVYVRSYVDDLTDRGVWRVHDGAVTRVCACRTVMLGVDSAGGLVSAGGAVPGMRPVLPDAGPSDLAITQELGGPVRPRPLAVASPALLASPAATALASVPIGDPRRRTSTGWSIALAGRPGSVLVPVTSGRIEDVQLLAWTRAGILALVTDAAGRSLRLVDPTSGAQRVVSRGRDAAVDPVAVASGLVGDGTPVTAAAPS